MISRRTVIKYTGLAWLGGITSDMFGHEVIEITDSWKPITRMETWMPEDGQVVLLATTGGGHAIWLATFCAAHDSTLHGKPLHTTWCFVTVENGNELWPWDLEPYSWMELPYNPFSDDGKWDHQDLTYPPSRTKNSRAVQKDRLLPGRQQKDVMA